MQRDRMDLPYLLSLHLTLVFWALVGMETCRKEKHFIVGLPCAQPPFSSALWQIQNSRLIELMKKTVITSSGNSESLNNHNILQMFWLTHPQCII